MILQAEYHASSIRLRRVILLRSGIRLTPSGIRYASFRANRISLKPQGFNITIAQAILSLFAKAKNITKKQRRESFTEFCNRVTLSSVLSQVSHLYNKCTGPCPYLTIIFPIRTTPISALSLLSFDIGVIDTDNTDYRKKEFSID